MFWKRKKKRKEKKFDIDSKFHEFDSEIKQMKTEYQDR